MSLAFKRMYVDIPIETHEKLVVKSAAMGLSQKGFLTRLIEDACIQKKPAKKITKKRSKKGG